MEMRTHKRSLESVSNHLLSEICSRFLHAVLATQKWHHLRLRQYKPLLAAQLTLEVDRRKHLISRPTNLRCQEARLAGTVASHTPASQSVWKGLQRYSAPSHIQPVLHGHGKIMKLCRSMSCMRVCVAAQVPSKQSLDRPLKGLLLNLMPWDSKQKDFLQGIQRAPPHL
jgi:hypothetical protein